MLVSVSAALNPIHLIVVFRRSYAMTDRQLLTSIEEATFRYFWVMPTRQADWQEKVIISVRAMIPALFGGSGMG